MGFDTQDMSWARELYEQQAKNGLTPVAEEAMLEVLKSRCMMTPSEIGDFMETVKYGLNEPGINVRSLVSEALPAKMNPQFKKGVVEELATYAAMKAEPASAAPAAAPAQPAAKPVTMKM